MQHSENIPDSTEMFLNLAVYGILGVEIHTAQKWQGNYALSVCSLIPYVLADFQIVPLNL